jgi:Phage tail lysozyme
VASVAQTIASVLINAGASKAGAAGVIGNFTQESSLNPSSPGGLLGQWQGSRYTALQNFAQSQGKTVTDPTVQAEFTVNEMKSQYPGLWNMLSTTSNPRAAALAVSQQYERPGDPMNQNRMNYAANAFQQIGGGGPSPGSPSGGSLGLNAGAQAATQQVFDQAGFDAARAKYLAGTALARSSGSANPYNVSPGATSGFASALGGAASSSPLYTKGLLTRTAPNASDFMTAQTEVQKLAGGTPLVPHPATVPQTGAGSDSTPAMMGLVSYAKAHAPGTSGQCLALVQDYLQATHSAGAAVPRFAYAHDFGDWLNQSTNAASVGLKRLATTDPYDAPVGAIVVVPYGAPGTSMPGAGDISIAAGNGQFINDHENENYGGASGWASSGAKAIGIYVPVNYKG